MGWNSSRSASSLSGNFEAKLESLAKGPRNNSLLSKNPGLRVSRKIQTWKPHRKKAQL